MIKYVEKFILFLKFDLRLSDNTVQSYNNDLHKYIKYFGERTLNFNQFRNVPTFYKKMP